MKTKPIIVVLATLLIGSLFLWACQDDNILSGIPDITEQNALKSGQAETLTDGNIVKMVPFRGSGTYEFPVPPEVIEEIIDGEVVLVLVAVVELEGHATRLGRFQGFETWRFRFDPEGPDGAFGDYLSHKSKWIAANGDELHNEGSVEHGSVHEFYEPLGTGFSLTGVRIVGGTSRFENAAGWYDFWVIPTSDSGGTWELEGEISFGKMAPFRGSGTYEYVEFAPDFDEMEIKIVVALEGHATHLGRFQGIETYHFKFMTMEGAPVPTEYLSHSSTYTAANGDELHIEGSVEHGSGHEWYVDGTGFSLTGVHIVGGTGRFENAVGWYDFWVTRTSDLGGTWEFEGGISSVGSKKTVRGR